jgi:hypothetical protein
VDDDMSLAAGCRFPRASTATDVSKCQISYHLHHLV